VPLNLQVLLPLAALELILMVAALVDLVRRGPARVRGSRVLWGLAIIVLQIIGPVAYFLFGRRE